MITKKILPAAICFVIVVAGACKKSGSDAPAANPTITGKWISTENDVTFEINGVYGAPSKTKINDPSNYIEYNSDLTCSIASGNNNAPINNYTYTVSGNIITLSAFGSFIEADTIKQLTANTLWLRQQWQTGNTAGYNILNDKYYTR